MFNLAETKEFIKIIEEMLEKADKKQKVTLEKMIIKFKSLKRSIETGGLGGD